MPSFLNKSKEESREVARRMGLPEPAFIILGDITRGLVVSQQPKAGTSWDETVEEVTLELE